MAGIDDAEAVPFGIGEYHEIGVSRIRVPLHTCGAEVDQALDLGGLFDRGIDNQVDMDSRVLLGPTLRPLQSHSRSLARRWDEDRELVVGVGKSNRPIAEHLRPERHRTIDVCRRRARRFRAGSRCESRAVATSEPRDVRRGMSAASRRRWHDGLRGVAR